MQEGGKEGESHIKANAFTVLKLPSKIIVPSAPQNQLSYNFDNLTLSTAPSVPDPQYLLTSVMPPILALIETSGLRVRVLNKPLPIQSEICR